MGRGGRLRVPGGDPSWQWVLAPVSPVALPGPEGHSGTGAENHLPFAFSALQALPDLSAEDFVSCQRHNPTRRQNTRYNFMFSSI